MTLNKLALLLALPIALSACDEGIQMDVEGLAGQAFRDFENAVVDPSKICSDIKFAKSAGGVMKGTRDCKIPENLCTEPGQTGCYIVDPDLYGLNPDDLKPENIREGIEIAEVTGAMIPNDRSCREDGKTGCVATQSYPSVFTTAAAAKVPTGEKILGHPGSFNPDFPELASVLTTATVAGQPGQLPTCSVAVTTECVLSTAYRAVPVAALVPADIKQNSVIGAVTGSYITSKPDCVAGNATDCVATTRYKSIAKSRVIADNLQTGYQVLGVNGSVLVQHSACSSDNQTACLATAPYKAINKANLNPGLIRSGVTIAGVTGDYPSATYPLPNADTGIHDLTSTTFNSRMAQTNDFELWDATGTRHVLQGSGNLTASRVINGTTIFDVTGNLGTRPDNCSADGEEGCVTVAAFPAIKASTVSAGVLRNGVTIAGVTGTYPSAATPLAEDTTMKDLNALTDLQSASQVEFFDAAGARHVVQGTPDLAPENILSGVTLFGVNGSAIAKPVACTGQNGVGCVADDSYPAYKKSDLTAAVIKKGVTIGGVTGVFPSASSTLLGNSSTTDLTSGNFESRLANSGNLEFWDATGARHTVKGDADLKADNILSGVTIFGIAGNLTKQPLACSLKLEGCLTTATYPSYDPSVVHPSVIKNGTTIGKMTGDYPSATYKLPGEQATTVDLTATNFNSRMATAQASEFWTSAGVRHTAQGDNDLDADKIRKDITLFGVAGTALASSSNCTGGDGVGCVTTTAYPSYQKSKLTDAVLKKGVTIGGVTGDYPSATNRIDGASSSTKDLTAANFDSSMADTTTFEYWTSAGVRQTNQGDTDLVAGHLTQGTTVYGVTGTMAPAPANCVGSNKTGCVANGTYPALNKSQVTEGVIKNGVTLLGVSGKYPSASYPLAGSAAATHDLTSGTFAAKMRSGSTFEFFDSEGNRFTKTGDSDILAGNIKNGVSIYGVSGSFVALPPDVLWDVVHTASIAGVKGRVKPNCRNQANYDFFGPHDVAADEKAYLSIDDYNGGGAFPSDNPWGATTDDLCEADVWLDVSYDNDAGQNASCVPGSSTIACMYKDRISNLTWHDAPSSSRSWSQATSYCSNLSVAGHSDWRLPTLKEALAAYVHGIHRIGIAHSTYRTTVDVWTSTSYENPTTHAIEKYKINLAQGWMKHDSPSASIPVHCVR